MKAILSIVFVALLCSCSSTTVYYKTPHIRTVVEKKPTEKHTLVLSTNRENKSNYLSHSFNTAFANTVKQAKDFTNVYNLLHEKTPSQLALETTVKVDRTVNPLNILASIFSFGLIPCYEKANYDLMFKFKSKESIYSYNFNEETSSWVGFLVVGKDVTDDSRDTRQEIFSNISKNLILQLRSDNVLNSNEKEGE